jgi:hypothetical protein
MADKIRYRPFDALHLLRAGRIMRPVRELTGLSFFNHGLIP